MLNKHRLRNRRFRNTGPYLEKEEGEAFLLAVGLYHDFLRGGSSSAGLWVKYTAPDGSCSFHYPTGWIVSYSPSIISIDNKQTDEQLLMAGVPFDQRKSPAELAAGFIALLKESNPNVRAFNWQTEPKTANSQVLFELSDRNNGKQYTARDLSSKRSSEPPGFRTSPRWRGFQRSAASLFYRVLSARWPRVPPPNLRRLIIPSI